ncbi:hypothetical protein GJ496_002391 [Pomphorhynchus laevis]|nr:hypothetical protein GJ496_011422 [Pomphorhynchus laevis]KAI0980486.1 hypothetical protein GJ496_002391 [Pomphorhynchus laevis]
MFTTYGSKWPLTNAIYNVSSLYLSILSLIFTCGLAFVYLNFTIMALTDPANLPIVMYQTNISILFQLTWGATIYGMILMNILVVYILYYFDKSEINELAMKKCLLEMIILSLTVVMWFLAMSQFLLKWIPVIIMVNMISVQRMLILIHFSVTPLLGQILQLVFRNFFAMVTGVYIAVSAQSLSVCLFYYISSNEDITIPFLLLNALKYMQFNFEMRHSEIFKLTCFHYLVLILYEIDQVKILNEYNSTYEYIIMYCSILFSICIIFWKLYKANARLKCLYRHYSSNANDLRPYQFNNYAKRYADNNTKALVNTVQNQIGNCIVQEKIALRNPNSKLDLQWRKIKLLEEKGKQTTLSSKTPHQKIKLQTTNGRANDLIIINVSEASGETTDNRVDEDRDSFATKLSRYSPMTGIQASLLRRHSDSVVDRHKSQAHRLREEDYKVLSDLAQKIA